MKERFELVYYIALMLFLVGGIGGGIFEATLGYYEVEPFIKYIGIGVLMTLGRFIVNGKHFWNPPFKRPNIFIIIVFTAISSFVVLYIEYTIRFGFTY